MTDLRITLATALMVAACSTFAQAQSASDPSSVEPTPANPRGSHGFDFEFGSWRVHHRVKLPGDSRGWMEFDGTCSDRPLMDGLANVEDHVFNRPDGVTRGVGLRTYDPKTGEWAIWWVDGRNPHGRLDPPVKGRFDSGVGTFFSDDTVNGKPVRVRYTWSKITPASAHWEQAYSTDAGKTWETNWFMDFQRIGAIEGGDDE